MSKQDWLDYFEAVNGRSASAEEIAQALAAGEFQEEVVLPETPQAPEFVAYTFCRDFLNRHCYFYELLCFCPRIFFSIIGYCDFTIR